MQDNPNYSYIGTVKTPDGQTHYYKDAEARAAVTAIEKRVDLAEEDIELLKEAVKGGTHFIGKCQSSLTDRCTTNPVQIATATGTKAVSAKAGDFTVCEKTVGTGKIGIEFLFDGTCWTELGSTGTLGSLAYKDTASGTYKPEGTVSKPTATVTPTTETIAHLTVSVDEDSETLIIGSVNHTVVKSVAVDVSQPTFSGTQKAVSVS